MLVKVRAGEETDDAEDQSKRHLDDREVNIKLIFARRSHAADSIEVQSHEFFEIKKDSNNGR